MKRISHNTGCNILFDLFRQGKSNEVMQQIQQVYAMMKPAKKKGPSKTGRSYWFKGTRKAYPEGYNKTQEQARRLRQMA